MHRFPENPLLTPADLKSSREGLKIECLLNPGAFECEGKVWLLVRVAERPTQREGFVSFPIMQKEEMLILEFASDDPDLNTADPREYKYQGIGYLSTLSHLRLLSSEDGIHFKDAGRPSLMGVGEYETYGIEDCRVTTMQDGSFLLTYTAVSANGYGVGLRRTKDWKTFEHLGLITLPPNKDAAIFEEKIGGNYVALTRPSGVVVGGHYIWLSRSPDLKHWGEHVCIAKSRPGRWDCSRIGAGAAPIKTSEGWLEIYHGADHKFHYHLGALLLDLEDPSKVLARGEEPIFSPEMDYEKNGFFGQVVFTNGHIVRGDELTIYYGASDSVVCGVRASIKEILASLG